MSYDNNLSSQSLPQIQPGRKTEGPIIGLEDFIASELRALPMLKAPPTLIPTVMKAISRDKKGLHSWFFQPWDRWPRPAKCMLLSGLAITLYLLCHWVYHWQSTIIIVKSSTLLQRLQDWLMMIATVLHIWQEILQSLFKAIGTGLVVFYLTTSAIVYLFCVATWTAIQLILKAQRLSPLYKSLTIP